MADGVFHFYISELLTGNRTLTGDTLRILLVSSVSTYTLNPDHQYLSDLTANGLAEPTDGSYSRQTLTGVTVTHQPANDRVLVDANDADFGKLVGGETAIGYVVYAQVGGDDTTPGDDPVVQYVDSPTDRQLNGDNFVVRLPTDGFKTFT